jgi:hypothetical protein
MFRWFQDAHIRLGLTLTAGAIVDNITTKFEILLITFPN